MKRGGLILVLAGVAIARPLFAAGMVSEGEMANKNEQTVGSVVPQRDLLYNPITQSQGNAEPVEPVLDEQTYLEDNIVESGQISVDRAYDFLPFPKIFPYNVLDPQKGYLRADDKWDIEPRASTSWSYDTNVQDAATHRDASEIISTGAGMTARLGTVRPDMKTGVLTTPYAVLMDFDASYDRYLEKPSYNALNRQMRLEGRIGRDTFIVTPHFNLGDITSRPIIDLDRTGLIRQRFLQSGVDMTWRFHQLTYFETFTNSQVDQPDNLLFNYDSFFTHHELSFTSNIHSRYYVYGEYQNILPTEGTFGHQEEGGIGYDYVDNETLLGRFRWKVRVGWEQITYQNNPVQIRDNSGIRLQSQIGGYLTPKWEWIFRVGRDHQFDTSLKNNGYLEDYLSATCYWRPTDVFGIGATYFVLRELDDRSNANPFYQRVMLESNWRFSNHSLAFFRSSYEHSITAETADPDVVDFRQTIGVEFRF